MRISHILSAAVALLLPVSALALEGIGPRVTVTGVVEEVNITDKQVFNEEGGEYLLKASNGQLVHVILNKDTEIISEGRISRRSLLPVNVTEGTQVRIRGWRTGTNALTASLIIILNIELNPTYSLSGVIQSIDGNTATLLSDDGRSRTLSITNETEVNVNYTARGTNGLSLVGKQAIFTLNPMDNSQVRVIRITGEPVVQTAKPTSVELKMR